MFSLNSRVNNKDGITFYEQDILYDYLYSKGNITIEITGDYMSPGLGFSFIERNTNNTYILKLGYKEISLYFRTENFMKLLHREPCSLYPYIENIHMVCSMDKSFTLKINNKLYFEYKIPHIFEEYKIGIYSNKGNTIKKMNCYSNVPKNAKVNMENTNGGHLLFFKNGFTLLDCKNPAELEFYTTKLNKGTYYINFDKVKINDFNDINVYCFEYKDNKIINTQKNILKDNMITLLNNTNIIIKFVGTKGIIKNIQISDDENSSFIETFDTEESKDGSSIKVNCKNVEEISFDIKFKNEGTNNFIISDKYICEVDYSKLNLKDKNIIYKIIYSEKKQTMSLFDSDNNLLKSFNCSHKTDYMYFLYNIECNVFNFNIKTKDNKNIDIINNDNYIKFIPDYIKSPITIIDNETNEPFDLSASYRYDISTKKYIFTNIEREIFKTDSNKCILEKTMSETPGSFKIYGIYKNEKIDINNIYNIKNINDVTIQCLTEKYDILTENNILYVDKNNNSIYLKNIENYDYIIIDYLKEKSFCINYDYKLKGYTLDISSSLYVNSKKQKYQIIYNEKNDYSILENIKINDINNNSYLVLNTR